MTAGVYIVTGKRPYRGHEPGVEFHAALEPGPEQRAIGRGDIELVERIDPSIQPDSFTLPTGWLTTQQGGQ